jgi:hypothetical protein
MKPLIAATVSCAGLVGCATQGIDPVIPYSAYPRAAEIRRLLAREDPPLCDDWRAPGVEAEGCVDNLDAWNDRRARLEAELARFVPWGETQAPEPRTAAAP